MINLEPLITRNLEYSQLINRLIKKAPDHIYPTITISRDPGSGGKEVAKKVAEALQIKCFDDELIDMVSKQANIKKKLVKALDEKTQSAVDSIINSFLGYDALPANTFIRSFATVVLSIAASQPAVILGRGMNFVLPPETNLRVRVTAPRRKLVEYAMEYEHHSAEKAREIIDKYMTLRRDFVYKYFSKDERKPHYFDLVINTEFLSIEDTVQIVISAFKQKFRL